VNGLYLVQYETSQQLREAQLLEAMPFIRLVNLERSSCTPAFLHRLHRWGARLSPSSSSLLDRALNWMCAVKAWRYRLWLPRAYLAAAELDCVRHSDIESLLPHIICGTGIPHTPPPFTLLLVLIAHATCWTGRSVIIQLSTFRYRSIECQATIYLAVPGTQANASSRDAT
jgi:hypothetical protein